MPAFVLYGDSFLVPRRQAELVAELGAGDVLEANRHLLSGSQLRAQELIGVCNAFPFMDSMRVVVVEGLLATAETRGGGRGRGRRREPSGASPAAQWQPLVEAIPVMPDTTLLVFTDGPLAANNPLLRQLRTGCQVEELSAPAGERLARWIKETAEAKGASISPAANRSLADLVGSDLWTLDQELEKLSLYAFGREINESDVQLMVSQVREASIFVAVDAMIDGRPAVALKLLHQLKEDGKEPSYIISMVERQLRLLALARDSMDRGLPSGEMGSRLGVTSDFVVRKTVDQARRHSMEGIVWRYNRLLETDLAIKQGQLTPELALELLVGESAPVR